MENEKDLVVVDLTTGEIKNEIDITDAISRSKVTRDQVDTMLYEADGATDLDVKLLYKWCKITKGINRYGQIQTFGNKLNDEVEDLLLEEGVVCAYVIKAIKSAHPFSGILKNNHKSFMSTWKELYKHINCNGRKEQIKVKKFLVENGLIDMFKINIRGKEIVSRLVLNPYLYKGASHSGQISCILWQSYAKESININMYAYRWLQGMGYIK